MQWSILCKQVVTHKINALIFLFVKKVRNDEQCVQKKSKRKKLGFTAAVIIAQIVERKKKSVLFYTYVLSKLCIPCTC